MLGQLVPDIKVSLNNNTVCTERLASLAQKSDLFVFAWRSSKHAAYYCIKNHRPKDLPIVMPRGKGTASILHASATECTIGKSVPSGHFGRSCRFVSSPHFTIVADLPACSGSHLISRPQAASELAERKIPGILNFSRNMASFLPKPQPREVLHWLLRSLD